jgi:Flp pilus assembly protein TadG
MRQGEETAQFAGAARPAGCLTRLWRNRDATTSLEFALVALPFFSLIIGTMSLGIWHFYSSALDLAVYNTARQFMTGQVQASGTAITPAQFSSVLCANIRAYMPCSATNPVVNINVVQDFNDFVTTTTVTLPGPPPVVVTKSTLNPLPPNACSPAPLDIVYIQAVYQMPTLPVVYSVFGGTIISGTTVQVEEFPVTASVATNC